MIASARLYEWAPTLVSAWRRLLEDVAARAKVPLDFAPGGGSLDELWARGDPGGPRRRGRRGGHRRLRARSAPSARPRAGGTAARGRHDRPGAEPAARGVAHDERRRAAAADERAAGCAPHAGAAAGARGSLAAALRARPRPGLRGAARAAARGGGGGLPEARLTCARGSPAAGSS